MNDPPVLGDKRETVRAVFHELAETLLIQAKRFANALGALQRIHANPHNNGRHESA